MKTYLNKFSERDFAIFVDVKSQQLVKELLAFGSLKSTGYAFIITKVKLSISSKMNENQENERNTCISSIL
jgi:NADH/NAD ratio-sensing transcriptional regulator Rex